jgi:hypothetical protein
MKSRRKQGGVLPCQHRHQKPLLSPSWSVASSKRREGKAKLSKKGKEARCDAQLSRDDHFIGEAKKQTHNKTSI